MRVESQPRISLRAPSSVIARSGREPRLPYAARFGGAVCDTGCTRKTSLDARIWSFGAGVSSFSWTATFGMGGIGRCVGSDCDPATMRPIGWRRLPTIGTETFGTILSSPSSVGESCGFGRRMCLSIRTVRRAWLQTCWGLSKLADWRCRAVIEPSLTRIALRGRGMAERCPASPWGTVDGRNDGQSRRASRRILWRQAPARAVISGFSPPVYNDTDSKRAEDANRALAPLRSATARRSRRACDGYRSESPRWPVVRRIRRPARRVNRPTPDPVAVRSGPADTRRVG